MDLVWHIVDEIFTCFGSRSGMVSGFTMWYQYITVYYISSDVDRCHVLNSQYLHELDV
jgi:hypothetical protein